MAGCSSPAARTIFIPFPPPPADALTSSGKPIWAASRSSVSRDWSSPS
jgi:hypothetical protein